MQQEFSDAVDLFKKNRRGKISSNTFTFTNLFPTLEIFSNETSEKMVIDYSQLYRALSQRQSEIFIMYYLYKKSMQKIAYELKLAKSTVQDHLQTARSKVKNYLAKGE